MMKYKIDILLTFFAVLPACFSLGYDLSVSNEFYWFQRSGSLMVLFGVMLDFYQHDHSDINSSNKFSVNGVSLITGTTLSKARKRIQVFSIALAIVGTLIWGYGDLPFK